MPCKSVPQYLDAVRKLHAIKSDYALAGFLGVTRATVSNWRKGYSLFDDTHAAQVAALLDLHPCHLMACMHAQREREHPEIFKMWADVARNYEEMRIKKGASK